MVEQDLVVIKRFREMCGAFEDGGYYLSTDGIKAPVFIGIDHDIKIPEVIIRPFITNRRMNEEDFIVDDHRYNVKYDHARFQVDIYAKNIIELMKLKSALYRRLEDFDDVELIAYCEPATWELVEENIYLNPHYTENVVKIEEPLGMFSKKETYEELVDSPGTWFIDETGLYINPLLDRDEVLIFVKLNGEVFSDGQTMFDVGIHRIRFIDSRKVRDQEPSAERWITDFMVSYTTARERKLGEEINEAEINVQGT